MAGTSSTEIRCFFLLDSVNLRSSTICKLLLIAAFLVFSTAGFGHCQARTSEPGQSVVCENIQKQIDQLVELSKSTTLTEEEKVTQLSKSWTESVDAMNRFSGQDNENAKLVHELLTPIVTLMASALRSSPRDGSVSPDTKRDLEKVGELVKPYMGIMKMICPGISLPDNVPQ